MSDQHGDRTQQCVQCELEITGSPFTMPFTVDESVDSIPAGEGELTFCHERCFRDWLDKIAFPEALEVA